MCFLNNRTKFCLERKHIYSYKNRMRNLHLHGRLCLTFGSDAQLWYEKITMWAMIGTICKCFFCRKSSKLRQMQKELFQRWISFQFDEATDIIDSYVLMLKQCAHMLGVQ